MLRFLFGRFDNSVKKQIIEICQLNDSFAFSDPTTKKLSTFRETLKQFVESKTYGKAERKARDLMHQILLPHLKVNIFKPALEWLNQIELYEDINYKKQRLHFTHQVNVFLLGLLIYHNLDCVRENIYREIESTTDEITIQRDGHQSTYRYSGCTRYGEFLFRWRLASICHDVGYTLSLLGNVEEHIANVFRNTPVAELQSIRSIEELRIFDGRDLLHNLDEAIDEVSLLDYVHYQKDNPFMGKIFYDHGLLSGLIFYRLMHEEYYKYIPNDTIRYDGGWIVWHHDLLKFAAIQVALSIALHNLEHHKDALSESAPDLRIFSLRKRPLAWLLKVSDLLQEWDKPRAKERLAAKKISNTKVSFMFDKNRIFVGGLKRAQKQNIKATIENHFDSSDFLRFV